MKNSSPAIALFVVLISYASVGAVIVSPALIDIATSLGLHHSQSSQVINYFLIGYAVSQIACAILGNAQGTRKTVLMGAALCLTGNMVSLTAENISFFMAGRLMSGLGSGCGLALTFGIISACLSDEKELKKTISLTSSAFAVMPGISVFIGGVISGYFGWKSTFYFMILYSIFVAWIAMRLPDIRSEGRVGSHFFAAFAKKDIQCFLLPAIVWGLCGSLIYMFSSHLPVIYINEFNLAPELFSFLYALSMLGYFLGNILSGVFTKKLQSRHIVTIGMALNCLSALLFVFLAQFENPFLYFVAIFCLFVSFPLVFSVLMGQAMLDCRNKVVASSLSSFICMILSSFSLYVSGWFLSAGHYTQTEPVMTLILCMLISFLSFFYIRKRWMQPKGLAS